MTAAEQLHDQALRLLPPGYGCAVLSLRDPVPKLLPAEAACVARAVEHRQREFALGRLALRRAIACAGHDLPGDIPIRMRPDRRPDLPATIRASLSHAGEYCIAVAAPVGGASPGVDIEPCDRALPPDLAQAMMPYRAGADSSPILAFCAKEAMFKAQYPLTGQMLDFGAVPLVIARQRFRACLGRRLIGGRWARAAGYWLAVSLWRG
ncbi:MULTISPECIES: 4'-phosphopantetheinyl transferase family protein [unclassified Paracoccus (in: a-proteobacteria)]|uniref:4'-phosphopantetheinyl transferase family protein n=1 Tax=unclassified Paracoccus (in: a-proteobacteria) TaxID=2688777 RepID=UPI0012B3432D|nr:MULTISPECIES: 4-phosphopantetheinyl transferase [unclassified Paracoccus (in: a-proteobacteria)]UXU76141.1 4-phosphopantetheinyl transferase [Paracoccus sp. SMMA_5]UXU82053.1 4-phosphopantetheinyl transferase [Paracoccus sp. SMMA_5_TC]